jgi:hypothetical protein
MKYVNYNKILYCVFVAKFSESRIFSLGFVLSLLFSVGVFPWRVATVLFVNARSGVVVVAMTVTGV